LHRSWSESITQDFFLAKMGKQYANQMMLIVGMAYEEKEWNPSVSGEGIGRSTG